MTQSREEIARLSAAAMWADDAASRSLGLKLGEVGPGTATLSLTVAPGMVNGLGTCHGGYIFSLADTALAFASNSYNQRHVAQNCQITYIAPAPLGVTLVAEARERHRGERSAIYDVTVRSAAGDLIAEFRGMTRLIPGALVAEGQH